MKLPRISFLPLLFIPFFSCDTKGDFDGDFKKYFIKYYGEDGDQEAVDFIVNTDGTVLLLGNTDSSDGKRRILLVKVDAEGNIIWQKKYGSGKDSKGRNINENAQDIEATVDGKILILSNMSRGKEVSTNEELYDFKIIRILPDGVKIDSMEFGNNPDPNNPSNLDGLWKTQFIKSITPLTNGGFALTGNSTNENIFVEPLGLPTPPPDQEDLFSIAFNSDFTFFWNTIEIDEPFNISPGEHVGCGVKVFEKSPNEFIMFSYSDAQEGDVMYEENFNIAQFSSDGLPLWPFEFAGKENSNERLAFVCKIPPELGGGFYELGTSSIPPVTTGQLYFCKRSSGLVKMGEDDINLQGNFEAIAVAPSLFSQGFLILANEVKTTGTVIRLIKVNLNSEPQWSANFGSSIRDGNRGASVTELPDGRILIFGTIELETQKKMALIKVNPNGELLN